MAWHLQRWQQNIQNISNNLTDANVMRSCSAETVSNRYKMFILFNCHCCINDTYETWSHMHHLDTNVTDKGNLQNAMPARTILECFMSILSYHLQGSLRTRPKLEKIKQNFKNVNNLFNIKSIVVMRNAKNTYNIDQMLMLSCYTNYCSYFVDKLMHDIEPNLT